MTPQPLNVRVTTTTSRLGAYEQETREEISVSSANPQPWWVEFEPRGDDIVANDQ